MIGRAAGNTASRRRTSRGIWRTRSRDSPIRAGPENRGYGSRGTGTTERVSERVSEDRSFDHRAAHTYGRFGSHSQCIGICESEPLGRVERRVVNHARPQPSRIASAMDLETDSSVSKYRASVIVSGPSVELCGFGLILRPNMLTARRSRSPRPALTSRARPCS